MTERSSAPRRLRPRLRRRLPLFVLSVLLLAMSIVALFYSPLVGIASVLFFGFAAIIAALRLFHPRSYATELDANGFSTFDSFGRQLHRVAWADIEHLTVVHGNGIGGPGTLLLLAWRCLPRQPDHRLPSWLRARRNFAGEEIDGALSQIRTSESNQCWSCSSSGRTRPNTWRHSLGISRPCYATLSEDTSAKTVEAKEGLWRTGSVWRQMRS
jgi:hypothetical protein